jgi:hypothetical protein
MARTRLMLLGVLAVLAVGALASTSASAAKCEASKEGGDVALCIEGKEAADGPYTFTSVKKANTVSEPNVKGGPRIVCEQAR